MGNQKNSLDWEKNLAMMKYDKYLGKLFGEKINNNTSYTVSASETGSTFLPFLY